MKRDRILVLLRHAHRDTSDRAADNGLSDKGIEQAQALLKHYLRAFRSGRYGAPRILSSPKRRCIETVAAIAQQTGASIEREPELEEQRADESKREFSRRVARAIGRLLDGDDRLIVACSHGDWLPVALHTATGARTELKKGGWAEIHLRENGRPELRWLLQSFKNL